LASLPGDSTEDSRSLQIWRESREYKFGKVTSRHASYAAFSWTTNRARRNGGRGHKSLV